MAIYKPQTKVAFLIVSFWLALALCVFFLAIRWDTTLLMLVTLVPLVLGLFFLGPVLKNQVVEVLDDAIVVRSFWKRYRLDIDDITEIVRRKSGINSYCFHSEDGLFQITPLCYYSGEELEGEFDRLFGSAISL